jgi:4-amino-4-deoxy-L-arabinose transferase-like glycosyltransferase
MSGRPATPYLADARVALPDTRALSSPLAICLILTVLAAALRLYHLGDLPAWRDETVVYWLGEDSLTRLWSRDLALTGTHPPLFYTIHHFWNQLLAALAIVPSEVTIRLPSVMIGTLTIPVFYGVLGRCFGNRIAAIGSAFLAASPAHVEFSRTAKSEVLVVFLLILMVGFAVRLLARLEHLPRASLRDKGFLGLCAGYVLSAIGLLHAHSLGFMGLFIPSLLFATLFLSGRLRISAVPIWIVLNLLAVVVFIPWLVLLYEIARANTGYYWLRPISAQNAVAIFSHVLLDKYHPDAQGPDAPILMNMIAAALAASLVIIGCARALKGDARRRGVAIAFVLLPVLFFAVSQMKPVFWDYILEMFALPLLALLAGFALEAPSLGRAGQAAAIAGIVLFLLPAEQVVYRGDPEPWNDVAAFLASHTENNDPVLFSPPHAGWSVRFYWPTGTDKWRTLDRGPNVDFDPIHMIPSIPAGAAGDFVRDARRVWLVTDEKVVPNGDDLPALRAILSARLPLVTRETFASGLTVFSYARDQAATR